MIFHELLNKNPDIFLEKDPLIILYSKSAVFMSNNANYTKYTRHISRRVHSVRIGKNHEMKKIDLCEGGLKLAHIETKNVGENDLNYRLNYLMVRLDNF